VTDSHTHRVIVVGAGVIGLACAWRLAQRGVAVTVVDPAPGSGATWTAAGMLAPVAEYGYGEQALLRLNLVAAAGYPDFAAELERVAGRSIGYEQRGTLVAAWDAADLTALRDLHAHHLAFGLEAELLTARELRQREPALASGLAGALFAPGDHLVDNRALHRALSVAVEQAGGMFVHAAVTEVLTAQGRCLGVRLAGGQVVAADQTVVAAGAHTRLLAGLPAELARQVRAVKGQTVRLHNPDGTAVLRHVVRGAVKGVPVYLVPRRNGEVVIGATSEDAGFDVHPRAGAVYELLRDAGALVPELTEWTWGEVSTGLRPGTHDNAPLIGTTTVPGLLMATGHFRNGLLLAAVTADAIVAAVVEGSVPDEMAPFAPTRGQEVPV
jgi:glycine oxidase